MIPQQGKDAADKLTQVRVTAFCKADGKARELRDPKTPGLWLRVTPKGAHTWSLIMRTGGKARRFTVELEGRTALTLAEARAATAELRASVRQGVDPTAQRRAASAPPAAPEPAPRGLTLGGLIERHGALAGSLTRRWRHREMAIVRTFRPLLETPVIELDAADFRESLTGYIAGGGGPISGGKALDYVRAVLSWGAGEGLFDRSPAERVRKPKVSASSIRTRVLAEPELRALLPRFRAGGVYGALFRFILLTATRRGEPAAATWAEIDLDAVAGPEWAIPAARMKASQPHVVPLSAQAAALLRELRGDRVPGKGELIFRGERGAVKPLDNFERHRLRFAQESGVDGWVLHDLRRTAATIMSKLGVAPHVIELCLAHKPPFLKATYQVNAHDAERRAALQQLADHLDRVEQGGAAVAALPARKVAQ